MLSGPPFMLIIGTLLKSRSATSADRALDLRGRIVGGWEDADLWIMPTLQGYAAAASRPGNAMARGICFVEQRPTRADERVGVRNFRAKSPIVAHATVHQPLAPPGGWIFLNPT